MDNSNFMDFNDLERVEVHIESINQFAVDEWQILLKAKDENIGAKVAVNIGQATNILFGLSNSVQHSVDPSIFEWIVNLCKDAKVKVTDTTAYYVDDTIAKFVVKLQQNNKCYFYNLDSGDALALATILKIPIYVVRKYLDDIADEPLFVLE